MNCDTYLSMLATLPVEELAYAEAREHAAQCRDCDRVTRVVAERERNMLMAYGELYPSGAAAPITARALMISRRRRIVLFYRIGLGVATAASLLFVFASRRVAPAPNGRVGETFGLQCLAPEQAVELLRQVIPPSVSIAIRPDARVGTIRVSGSPEELVRVRSLLDRYDSPAASQCGVQLTVPKARQVP